MDTPQPFKKRRLDSAVHKPFKSPLRKPLKPPSNGLNASNLSNAPRIPPYDHNEISENALKPISSQNGRAESLPASTPRQTTAYCSNNPIHTEIHTITARTKSLDRTIIKTRQDIDTLSQALSILRSNNASELETLEEKWCRAARSAAEEIFASAKDRVNRMGGVGAWRERERERVERMRGWFEEEQRIGDDKEEEGQDGRDEETYREGPEKWVYDFRGEKTQDDENRIHSEQEIFQDDDVGLFPRSGSRDLLIGVADIHHGHDAKVPWYRPKPRGLEQGAADLDRVSTKSKCFLAASKSLLLGSSSCSIVTPITVANAARNDGRIRQVSQKRSIWNWIIISVGLCRLQSSPSYPWVTHMSFHTPVTMCSFNHHLDIYVYSMVRSRCL